MRGACARVIMCVSNFRRGDFCGKGKEFFLWLFCYVYCFEKSEFLSQFKRYGAVDIRYKNIKILTLFSERCIYINFAQKNFYDKLFDSLNL